MVTAALSTPERVNEEHFDLDDALWSSAKATEAWSRRRPERAEDTLTMKREQ